MSTNYHAPSSTAAMLQAQRQDRHAAADFKADELAQELRGVIEHERREREARAYRLRMADQRLEYADYQRDSMDAEAWRASR